MSDRPAMSERTRRRHMKELRILIESSADPIETRIAYAMEAAVHRVTRPGLVGWPSLRDEALIMSSLLKKDLSGK